MSRYRLPVAWACLVLTAAVAAHDVSDQGIDELISRMTLQEKAGQLTLVAAVFEHEPSDAERAPGEPTAMQRQLAEIRSGQVGAVFNGIGANWARQLQRAAVSESRSKIPVLISVDAIHGFKTIFPVPLAEAATWDTALAEQVARATAVEATAAGVAWNLAPNVDIARDARWGRGIEGAGEDVLLGRRMAAARVRGYQKRGHLRDDDAMLATPKHFVGYGAAEGGLDYNEVDMSERTLREVYLPPFRAAFDAGAEAVMAGFHDLGGIPAMANAGLLTDLLRGEWNFPGIVISDYAADHELVEHGVVASDRDAVKLAFMAGVDVSMTSRLYQQYLPELVASGEIPLARLDQAVRRVLRVKRDLGLFDRPYGRMDRAREKRLSLTPQTRALTRQEGRQAIVMLKNEHDILPLPRTGQRIALIGPFFGGPQDLDGPWTVFDNRHDAVSVEAGIKAALADPGLLSVTQGSDVDAPVSGGIDAAVTAARSADVVILAIGESETMSGEAQSRTEVVVPAAQQALAEAVTAVGKPVVVLLRTGRALALTGAVRNADSILVTWFLGAETGDAIADVLFGTVSPSGRLPVSFPQAPGQEPYYYAHKSTGRPPPPGPMREYTTRYQGLTAAPLYAFGYGLSYSSVEYAAVHLSAAQMSWNGTVFATSILSNTGSRAVDEVVQLYVHDRVATVTRPVRELKDFSRIHLEPGQSREVRFEMTRADLEFIGAQMKPVAEPGDFDVWIAPSAIDGQSARFTLLAETGAADAQPYPNNSSSARLAGLVLN